MGRRRVHDEQTAALLLRSAEQIVEREGLACLSLRRLAEAAGVSTRAVYSVFGSKDALVAGLGSKAFNWLGEAVAARPFTEDPVADLVEAGAGTFRTLVREHPVLFQIGVQASWPAPIAETIAGSASAAWDSLLIRTDRLAALDLLGQRTSQQAAVEFHAVCEGLASMETRGLLAALSGSVDTAPVWRRSLRALVAGFAAS